MEILNILPLPIMKCNYIPSEIVLRYLHSEEMNSNVPRNEQGSYGIFSKDTYLLNKSVYGDISKFISEHALKYAKENLGYDIEKIMFTQSWISHKLPGQIHKDHSHSNSVISGVYYFDNNSTTEPITFYRSTGVNGINSLQVAINDNIARPMFECEIQPQFGDIILFPSYLFHSVKINTSGKVRKSLAFNCVPPIFGKKEDLTELIIT